MAHGTLGVHKVQKLDLTWDPRQLRYLVSQADDDSRSIAHFCGRVLFGTYGTPPTIVDKLGRGGGGRGEGTGARLLIGEAA